MTYDELARDAVRYDDLTARYHDAWFHYERYVCDLVGPPAPHRKELHKSFRFANFHVHRTCTLCNMPERYHNNNLCDARAGLLVFRRACRVCTKRENPQKRKQRRAACAAYRRTGSCAHAHAHAHAQCRSRDRHGRNGRKGRETKDEEDEEDEEDDNSNEEDDDDDGLPSDFEDDEDDDKAGAGLGRGLGRGRTLSLGQREGGQREGGLGEGEDYAGKDEDEEGEDDAGDYCACPVFECYNIDLREHAEAIQTPYEDGILRYQWGHLPDYKEVYYWFWVMLGRWLFPLDGRKDWDDWQKLTCILGDAGTGKSVIGGILKDFVPANMSAALSQNAQEEFGLATCVGPQGPLRTIMFECSGSVKIPAQQFQSMSTGEPVTINIKNKDTYTCDRWPVHVLLIGNTKPPWEDNGFALARRLVVFYMRKVVTQKDGRLASRIIADTLGASLFKYSLFYRDAVSHYRVTDPLEKDPHRLDGRAVYPPTIIRFNDSVRTTMNPLYKMLYEGLSSCSEPLFLSPNNDQVFMPLDMFGQQYNEYCTVRVFLHPLVAPTFYRALHQLVCTNLLPSLAVSVSFTRVHHHCANEQTNKS